MIGLNKYEYNAMIYQLLYILYTPLNNINYVV